MNRFWSLLFFLVPVLGMAAFIAAANGIWPLAGAWLPENFAESGSAVDSLNWIVHAVSAFFFVGFGLTIGWLLWNFSAKPDEGALYFKSNLKLELLWSIVPASLLVFLAAFQWQTWNKQRVQRPVIKVGQQESPQPPLVRVVARQFGWEFHYAGSDQRHGTRDDFRTESLMVVPDDETVVMELESRDVIHSFFVPKLRLKNDIVPGTVQYAWFKPTATGEMNILCAELCGWGHYRMTARLNIVNRTEFEKWRKQQQARIAPPSLVPMTGSGP